MLNSYFASVQDSDRGPFIASYGRYSDVLVEEEGRWRFKERIADVEAIAPTAQR